MALQQSKPLQLAELNQRSAPLAGFDIAIYHPRIEDYEYTTKTGEKKKEHPFVVSWCPKTTVTSTS